MTDDKKNINIPLEKRFKKDFQNKCTEKGENMTDVARELIERWTYGGHYKNEDWMELGGLAEVREAILEEDIDPGDAAQLIREHANDDSDQPD